MSKAIPNIVPLFWNGEHTQRYEKNWTFASKVAHWAYYNLDINLFDNQIEIVNDVCNLTIKNIAILQSRSGGKTYSVGIGLLKLCMEIEGLRVGVFGPKADQACRIINDITTKIVKRDSKVYKQIDWKNSVKSRLFFKNGSEIIALSADETAQQEGWHFNILVLDEAHRLTDTSVNQRLIPMIGGMDIGKIIKIGISMYKNNFFKSCNSPRYKLLKKTWLECKRLLSSGSLYYNGIEYPTQIVDQLPLKVKEQLFSDRPDLHYDGEISEIDYKTQYNMEWVSDIDLELDENDQKLLISGIHDILTEGRPQLQEQYYFGLDTAAGTLLPGKKDLDFTALSIWRKNADNTKDKIACYEWQGNIVDQINEIKSIIHPLTGKFKCTFGIADYSNIAQSTIAFFQKEKIPIEGLMYNQTDPASKKNMKNAIFDQFKFELQSGRVKFPSLKIVDTNVVFKKSFNEWCNIERHIRMGINDQIGAPSDLHDDHPNADSLAIWAIDKMSTFKTFVKRNYKIPAPQINAVPPVYGRKPGGQQENRYLK